MKIFTVKRGRYRTKRIAIEESDLSKDRPELDDLARRLGQERAQAYQDAVASGDLASYCDELTGPLTLEQLLADARRLVLPILANVPGRRTIDAPDGGSVRDDPLAHAATMVNYHALHLKAAEIEPEEMRRLMVNAVMLGYRWCQVVTNRDNVNQTNQGREAQKTSLTRRQNDLCAWLGERGLRARDLRYSSRNRTDAKAAWAGARKRGIADSTFNRDLDAIEAEGY